MFAGINWEYWFMEQAVRVSSDGILPQYIYVSRIEVLLAGATATVFALGFACWCWCRWKGPIYVR